jgi:hypothetical protein
MENKHFNFFELSSYYSCYKISQILLKDEKEEEKNFKYIIYIFIKIRIFLVGCDIIYIYALQERE